MADSTSSMPVGTTGAGGGNVLRITGLNTGLDIDAMVKKMLTADQTKVDNAKQQQQLIQWKQEAYQSIIKDVKDLQSAYFDVTNSSNYLLSSGNYNNMTATSSDATLASAKASTTAVPGTYKIQVNKLAQSATITGGTISSQVQVTSKNPESSFNSSDWQGKDISFDIGGSKYTITLDDTTFSDLNDVVSNINKKIGLDSNLNGKVSASFISINNGDSDVSTGDYIKFNSLTSTNIKIVNDTTEDSNGEIHKTSVSKLSSLYNKSIINTSLNTKLTDLGTGLDENIVLNLKYNGTSKSINLNNTNGTATVSDLVAAIKNATGGAVTGKFDDMTGKFILQTTATGSISNLSIEGESDNGTSGTNLLNSLNMSVTSAQGSDAVVNITQPGSSTSTTLTESSNNFTVNGVSYSITGTTTADSPVNISVTQDTSKVHDLITNFIDKYNNLVGEIQDKLSEKKDYDYSPLTDSQKSSMSDTDITNWENKAKEGILSNDDNLEQLLNDLTSAFTTPVVDSSGKSVSTLYFGSIGSNSIGIDTSNDYSQGGKLSITDDQKFTDALTNHADDIMKLFTTTSDSTDPAAKFNQSGIFQRINDIVNSNVGIIGTTLNSGTLTKYANLQDDYSVSGGSGTGTLPDQIYTQQLLINTLTDRMNDDQTKYYNQFTQLETAMEQLNAQQSTLSMYLS
ncbi:flagellar filament capping protein FliD [Clostridium tyrobutyricum]|uniref:flagellar filament capping protein FliD n=1 Tax=Clostridium tyrobutyricum TaxID=1519 RepID=UPI000580522D|nr:flagellar filament capping protein FliD [Clostridium tyrobutyricum]